MKKHYNRLRRGDLCEPLNIRKIYSDHYYIPLFCYSGFIGAVPAVNIAAWPFVLPKTISFFSIGWRVYRGINNTYVKFGFYATDPTNLSSYPYPGKLIWGMSNWRLLYPAGEHTDGDYDPPIILPGNELIWAVQAGYTTNELGPGGSIIGIEDINYNPGNHYCAIPNILGYSSIVDPYFSNCYVYVPNPQLRNFPLPDPFPTEDVYLMDSEIPLFGLVIYD